MGDKDLSVVVSEMLRKQDRHSELIQETNETLKKFIEISINQFEQQLIFNEKQLSFNERQEEFNEKFLDQNKRVVDRLDSIEKLLVHVVDMDDRIKRLEAAVFK